MGKASKDALKHEISTNEARESKDRAMALKLKEAEHAAAMDRQRARTMVEKSEKAKTEIQVAAKAAIRKAVKNAAILASVEKAKVEKQESKERAGKDLGSANVLAARAQTSAEERVAKDDIRKARDEMKKVQVAKESALEEVKEVAKKHSENAKSEES